ncbi:hypothetical protein DK419_27200 [Methylobacterium terrae]|uniref:Uncharacterized protein n=1 Tax=Methylobacterium terrae TaxID=2202827 RepID=A0A2U8WTN5_9HYPH|nr:hypothetical protein [Methylobacterium terrae]AWN49569.1 hypothetical protein DK419_27200 [Methylobacterium terrae]
MLGSDTDVKQQRPAAGPGDRSSTAPQPLRALLDAVERAVLDLAASANKRETMHAVRSSLSDICALTETAPRIRRAVQRVVAAGERLAAMDGLPSRTEAAARGAAARALASLAAALVEARPSRIAVSLGRDW